MRFIRINQNIISFILIVVTILSLFYNTSYPQVQAIESNAEESIIYVDGTNSAGPWDGSIHYPYLAITDALENASVNSTIFVFSGHYEEYLFVNKCVKINGENKNETILYGSVTISQTNNVSFSQFTITTSESNFAETTAIFLDQTKKNHIVHNIITNHNKGILISNKSSNNIVKANSIQQNNIGLSIVTSSNNLIYANTIKDNNDANIVLYHSSNNAITQNIIMDAEQSLRFHTSKDRITQNYWGNSKNIQILPGYTTINRIDIVIPWIKILFHPLTSQEQLSENPLIIMDTSLGSMIIELYLEQMPITTQNFIDLVHIDFFDDLVFHRVIKDFVIQGGGYNVTGKHKESPFGPIPLEIHPDINHVNGAISMARTNDPDSATSQFFICDGAQHGLDGNYAAFGKILIGFETLHEISSVETTTKQFMDDWPIKDVVIAETILV